jgi:hypothetical protein
MNRVGTYVADTGHSFHLSRGFLMSKVAHAGGHAGDAAVVAEREGFFIALRATGVEDE